MKQFISLLAILLFFASCSTVDKLDDQDPPKIIGDPADVGVMIESFGFDAFRQTVLAEEEKENICISPMSISTALTMAWNGAAGTTYDNMAEVLNYSGTETANINAGFLKLPEDLVPASEKVVIEQANGLFWDENRLTAYDDFLTAVEEAFDSERMLLDFDQVDAAKETINNWVEDHTDDKIKDLIKKIEDKDVMFLINALYYKGDWDNPFAPESTKKRDFEKYDGTIVELDFMEHDSEFGHYISEEYAAIDLPFKGDDYTITFLLPANETHKGDFLADFDLSSYRDLVENKLETSRIIIKLPKFEVDYDLNLKDVLSTLGMGVAFEKGVADFTELGHSPQGPLYMSRVIHKVKLGIDEYGAEGAAAAAVVISADSAPPSVSFDQPFYFVLRHVDTQAVLFIGLVGHPQ